MSWAKVDDQLHSNEKVLDCSLAARGLWLMCLSWVADKETDGAVSRPIVKLHAGAQWQELSDELVSAGLWEVTDTGWLFHDYLDCNPSRSELEEERRKTAERKARWKEKNANGTPTERRSSSVPNNGRTLHPEPEPEPVPVSPPLREEEAVDTTALGTCYDASLTLPTEVENFCKSQADPERWERELRLELTGRPLTGNPHNYMMALLRKWKRDGLPEPTPAHARQPAFAPKETYAEKFRKLELKHGQKLLEENAMAEAGYGGMP